MLDEQETTSAFARRLGAGDHGVVRISRTADETRIVMVGDLDFSTVGAAGPIVDEECGRRPARVVIDLSALEFVDAKGLRLLVETRRRLADQGCVLSVEPPPAHVRRIFVLTGLDGLFDVQPDD